MQTYLNSAIEILVGKVGMLLLGAWFSLWWIPKEAPDFLMGLWKTWPYTFIAIFWGYLVRRIFNYYSHRAQA